MNTLKSIVTVLLITFCFSSVTALAQDDALIHQYKFDGNLRDSVGDSDGVYVEGNGVLNFIEGFDATPNSAINFDDAGEKGYMVYLGDYSPVQEGVDGEITVTFWILWYGATDKRVQDIINKRTNYEEDGMMWGINIPNGQTFSVRRRGSFADSSLNPDENEWTHITITMDGVNADFYKNGEPNDTQPYQFGTKYDANIHIGTAGNSNGSWREVDAFNGALDDLRFYSRKLTDAEIILTSYSPTDGATEVARDPVFSWVPSKFASAYDVYLGTDVNDVNDASIEDPRNVLVSQSQAETTYKPATLLDYGVTYYWRVDDVNDAEPISPLKGDVRSFTVLNYIVVEDFEDYNDYEPYTVWNTWADGYDDPTNGSSAGYPDPDFFAVVEEHYLENRTVHSGVWSMPLFYDNSSAMLSWVTRTLNADWTQEGAVTLTLFYHGDVANSAEPMYVALDGNAVVTNDDANTALVTEWTRWDIPLQSFADQGVNLTNVGTLSIGFGNKANPTLGGLGHVFFDDIRLYLPE